MKKIGVIVLLIGLLFTIATTFRVVMREYADPGSAAQIKIHHVAWEPMFGTILIVTGACMYKVGRKNEVKSRFQFRNRLNPNVMAEREKSTASF